jgi:glycosyltransferase involved in cell wall biosynthesis
MRSTPSPLADARALGRIVDLLRRERFDIVHLHSTKAGFLGRLAARIAGDSAVVYSPHGLFFLGDHGPWKRRFYLALEQLAGRLCDRIIAVSPSERDILLRYRIAPPERIVLIENGIEPIELPAGYDRETQRRALGQPGGLLIGTVARLAAQKNPFMFLDAAALVLRGLPDARFVWCGGGELAETALAHARALGIDHACTFLGHRDDALEIVAALDLFWLTSNYEGMPYALIEAMALRLPVIATDVAGNRDLVAGTAGLLVPQSDAPALAATTISLATRPDRRAALGKAAYARYLDRYTADRPLRAVEQLYENLARRRRAIADQPAAMKQA